MKKKICAFLIGICLLTVNVNNVYASAGQIVVGGSAVAVGGLGAVGLAGLSGPVVIAVFCGLMAFGFNVELTKQSEAAGMTKTAFVKSKIEDYCQEANKTLDVFCDGILSGMEILNDGRIALSDQAAKQIKQFGNWLVDTNQVREPTVEDAGGSTVTISGNTFPVIREGDTLQLGDNNGTPVTLTYDDGALPMAVFIRKYSGSTYGIILFTASSIYEEESDKTIDFTIQSHDVNDASLSYRNNYRYTFRYSPWNVTMTTLNSAIPYFGSTSMDTVIDSLDGSFDIVTGGDTVADNSFTGDKDDWASGNNTLDPTADKTTVIDPGLLGQLSLPQDTSIEWDWQKYLDAIQDILDRAKDDTQDTTSEGTDTDTDTPISITINPTIVIDPTVAKEDDSQLPPQEDRTPVIDKDEPVSDPDLAIEPLKFDLRNIFPFCIPWDFKDMLSKLNAEPVAPSYHVKWLVPFANEYLEFTVDLSGYNDVAAILRKMELFAFVVALAIATRRIFIRS